jgi:hypothetical protein
VVCESAVNKNEKSERTRTRAKVRNDFQRVEIYVFSERMSWTPAGMVVFHTKHD